MRIHFNCSQCGKALFSDEQFAGRRVLCPRCQTQQFIPDPVQQFVRGGIGTIAVPIATPAAEKPLNDQQLIDMERGPEPDPSALAVPRQTTARVAATAPPHSPLEQRGEETTPQAQPEQPGAADPVKKCPVCAETIKAAAKRCRFCGTILDDEMRAAEELARRQQAVAQILAGAERNTRFWRSVSIVVTTFTVGWLTYLTLNAIFRPEPPGAVIIFNVLLIAALFSSSRQMRAGPHMVFLAAALAIMVCMPLNLKLGLVMVDQQSMEQMLKGTPTQPPMTREQIEAFVFGLFSITGFLFSLPVWVATLKVAALQRLRAAMASKAGGAS